MKAAVVALLAFLLGTVPTAQGQQFDYSVLHGEWGAYEKNLIRDDWYTYFQLGPKGGLFSYSYRSGSSFSVRFDETQMTYDNGLLLIELTPESRCPNRLVLSAFRTEKGSALLTGSLYMFKCEGERLSLFNTIPQRMTDLSSDSQLAERVRSTMADRTDR